MKTFNWITSSLLLLFLVTLFYSEYEIQTTVIDVYGQPDGMGIMLLVYLQAGVFITAAFLLLINLLLLFKKQNRTRHIAINIGALSILLILVPAVWMY
jgi:hypothetical protein